MKNMRLFSVSPCIPPELGFLEELAYNPWWCTDYDAIELLRRIDPARWKRVRSNSVEFLNQISQQAAHASQRTVHLVTGSSKHFPDSGMNALQARFQLGEQAGPLAAPRLPPLQLAQSILIGRQLFTILAQAILGLLQGDGLLAHLLAQLSFFLLVRL